MTPFPLDAAVRALLAKANGRVVMVEDLVDDGASPRSGGAERSAPPGAGWGGAEQRSGAEQAARPPENVRGVATRRAPTQAAVTKRRAAR